MNHKRKNISQKNAKMCWQLLSVTTIILFVVLSCRKDEGVIMSEKEKLLPQRTSFYLLNEGNMGMNKATLDYFEADSGIYHRNIYAETNPSVVKELGDVGNDLKIYGSKLYAVINNSNLVEVMRVSDAKHITQFEVLNSRYITFHRNKAYVSSYAGPIQLGNTRLGLVLEVDTSNFQVTRQVTVGYQPEEMAIVDGKLYVANSGGYTAGAYDRTISVIDLETFTETKKIDVAINLHRMKADAYGDIYVSSRGDYYSNASKLYVIDTKTDQLKSTIDVAASNFCIMGDTAYIYGTEYNHITGGWKISYHMVDVTTETVLPGSFITDGTDALIEKPYGIAVDPISRDIYVTDATNYISSGKLYCFDKYGKKKEKWPVTTGDIPAHIAFISN